MSRVPLREALRSLEEMGLISIKPGVLGGAFVAEMGIKSVSDSLSNMMRLGKISIKDIWQFRLLIEPNICRLAAAERTDWDLQQIEEIISHAGEGGEGQEDPGGSRYRFSSCHRAATRNPLLILIMDAVGQSLFVNLKRLHLQFE